VIELRRTFPEVAVMSRYLSVGDIVTLPLLVPVQHFINTVQVVPRTPEVLD
jgi:hypothetical protein